MKNDKYVVVKAEDVTWRGRPGDEKYATLHAGSALDDAVVIRLQDAFAAPALWTYANSIGVTLAALKRLSSTVSSEEVQRTIKTLQGVADFFHEAAEAASERGGRLPD